MIKLIAIDIDGTLLNSQHRLTQKVIDTIKRAKAQGVKIVLCTGRPIVGILPYLEKLDLLDSTDIAITQNGALVQETASKKVLSHLTIELEQLPKISSIMKEFTVSTIDEPIEVTMDPPEAKRGIPIIAHLLATGLSAPKPLRTAFIFDRDPASSSWLYQHELGRTHVNEIGRAHV